MHPLAHLDTADLLKCGLTAGLAVFVFNLVLHVVVSVLLPGIPKTFETCDAVRKHTDPRMAIPLLSTFPSWLLATFLYEVYGKPVLSQYDDALFGLPWTRAVVFVLSTWWACAFVGIHIDYGTFRAPFYLFAYFLVATFLQGVVGGLTISWWTGEIQCSG